METHPNISHVQEQVDGVRGIVTENIEKILNREANLEALQRSCQTLELEAAQFKIYTRKVKKRTWLRQKKNTIILISVVVLVVLLLTALLLLLLLFLAK